MDKTPIGRLRKLRKKANGLARTLVKDLKPFLHEKDEMTFRRLPDSKSKLRDVGVTTTCTCLMALAIADKLKDLYNPKPENTARKAFESVVSATWESSGLPESNAFTSTLVLRAFSFLKEKGHVSEKDLDEMKHKGKKPKGKKPRKERTLREIAESLVVRMPKEFGVLKYPPAPAIVFWFIDAINRAKIPIKRNVWDRIVRWVSEEFTRQQSLVYTGHEVLMDPVSMAMAACLSSKLRRLTEDDSLGVSPRFAQNLASNVELKHSILTVFNKQNLCGIWPKYFPLFHYPDAGSNYCFTFEMLEAVLNECENGVISVDDEEVLDGLEKAVNWCQSNRLEYFDDISKKDYLGWNSGGQILTLKKGEPESWATAVVHMFLHKLQDVLTQKIEDLLLEEYNTIEYEEDDSEWKKLIDIDLKFKQTNEELKVKDVLRTEIFSKVSNKDRKEFRSKPMHHKHSALLFGPSGTSKTSIVKALAQMLGWPLIIIEPSHFLSKGLEYIYSEADSVFEDLSDLSGVIVLFDEMDALVRTREGNVGGSLDVTSRFLTTSMLPKLARLHDDGQIIFFMATNYQGQFDPAIKRPGRFDMLLCMWPPSWKNKVNRLDTFIGSDLSDDELKECQKILLEFAEDKEVEEKLDRFTFDETKAFFEHLCKSDNLRTVLDDKPKEEFKTLVKDWSQQIIINEDPWEDGRKFKNTYEQYNSEKDTSCLH